MAPGGARGLPMAGAPAERADAVANRRRVVEAARRIIARDGAEALRMDAVAAEAGVGKGTVFRRFGDRAGLVRALLDETTSELQDAFLHGPPPLGPGAPPDERLEAFAVAVAHHNAEVLPIALLVDALPGQGRRVAGGLIVHAAQLLREAGTRGDPVLLAIMLLGALSASAIDLVGDMTSASGDDVDDAVRALVRGLLAA
jgi:AcrR family transcriptional regulator